MIQESKIFNVFYSRKGKKLVFYTKNLTPGRKFFNEDLEKYERNEYREFDPTRSKLLAAIANECKDVFLRNGTVVLYLGASHGYTPSFMSDIVGPEGFIFALDFAPRVVRDLVGICEARTNMLPILGDALFPESYSHLVSQVDVVYQDIAQRSQAEIFMSNCDMYLKKSGFGILMVKSRSVDVTKKPEIIYKGIREKLEKKYIIVDSRKLDPHEKDHCMFIIKKK